MAEAGLKKYLPTGLLVLAVAIAGILGILFAVFKKRA